MHALPTDWSALCAIIFLLGMRHGFDADHLATIDGLTRLSARRQRVFSRYCGVLFSLGHGVVVLAIAVVVGSLSERWAPPAWLDSFGAWTSIAFLLLLGIANLHAVLQASPDSPVHLVGIKSRVFGRILQVHSALGVLFVLVTDGLNGWWISRLIARADQIAVLASRTMGVAVAGVSLLVAGLGIGKLASPWIEVWSEGRDLAIGGVVVIVIAASFLVASALARRSHRLAGNA